MGRPMAESLLRAGHILRVYDARAQAAGPLIAAGATLAKSPADAARGVDIVFTSLPGPAEVEAISSVLLESIPRGAVWADLTTNSPEVVRRLHAVFAERGIALLDAPV